MSDVTLRRERDPAPRGSECVPIGRRQTVRGKNRTALIGLAALAFGLAASGGSHAASTHCVGGTHCYSTLQAAVNAAHNGDTIRIDSGTFAGGVTITSSVNLVGAGAKKTTISGGGPVLTIGAIFAATEPTVSIDGVTITDGVTTSRPSRSR